MTKEQILALSKMSEGEQESILQEQGVLELRKDTIELDGGYWESLADLADRLWREAGPNRIYAIHEVSKTLFECNHTWHDHDYIKLYRWWALDSLPIHRIQAALLAKEGECLP